MQIIQANKIITENELTKITADYILQQGQLLLNQVTNKENVDLISTKIHTLQYLNLVHCTNLLNECLISKDDLKQLQQLNNDVTNVVIEIYYEFCC